MVSPAGICFWCEQPGDVGERCREPACYKRRACYVPRIWFAALGEQNQPKDELGQRYGDFVIVKPLGAGAFGQVFVAVEVDGSRRAALKLLNVVPQKHEASVRERFENEVKALKSLDHPHIVRFIDGQTGTSPYLLMGLVDGGHDLQAELRQRGKRLDASAARDLLRQLVAGLEAAHDVGIIHRDIKPANLMLAPVSGYATRQLKILDFGLAKFLEDGSTTRVAIGSPPYMAPEQILVTKLGPLGPWTDIYAVGAIAFELLLGRRAFPGNDGDAIAALKRDANHDPMRAVAHDELRPKACVFLARCLAYDPRARFQTMVEVRAALEDAFDDLEAHDHSADISQLPGDAGLDPVTTGGLETAPGASDLPAAPTARRRPLALVAAAAVLAIGVGLVVVLTASGNERPTTISPDPGFTATVPARRPYTPTSEPDTRESAPDTHKAEPDTVEPPSDTIEPPPTVPPTWGVRVDPPAEPLQLGLAAGDTALTPTMPTPTPTCAFEVQRREVTVGEYRAFAPRAPAALSAAVTQGPDDWPIVGVPYASAAAYCQSIGARLPSEAEWEWAARGPSLRLTPTGAVIAVGVLGPVGRRAEDRTPNGLDDMLGNAREWTATTWRPASAASKDDPRHIYYRALRGLPPGVTSDDGLAYRRRACANPDHCGLKVDDERSIGLRCVRTIGACPP